MKRFLIALAGIVTAVFACGAPPPTPPAGLPTIIATRPVSAIPLRTTAIPFDRETVPAGTPFAPYSPQQVSSLAAAPTPAFDLDTLNNLPAFQSLTVSQQAQLAGQGFLIVPGPDTDPLAIYAQAGSAGQPVYVTADLILYAVHQLTSLAGQQAERDYLGPDLLALSTALLAETERQAALAPDAAVEQAARHNQDLIAVGLRLQDTTAALPPEVSGRINDELTLIQNADGRYISPLRGVEADYMLYAPTGAAIVDEQIRGYRQATIWYTQSSLQAGHPDPLVSRPAARRVLLLLHALERSQNLSRWDRLQAAQTYLWGTSLAPSVFEARALAEAVYGRLPTPLSLNEEGQLDSFIATWQATWGNAPFRLLPLPARPDTPVFPALVFDQVGRFQGDTSRPPATALESNLGLIRGLPTGLDIAAALGNDVAEDYLIASGNALYADYAEQLAAWQTNFAGWDETAWTRTRPDSLLYGLQPLLANSPVPTGRQLNSWYGGWALTRQEPVWVSRPVSTSPLPAPGGYVDPLPVFYARQAAQVRQLSAGLDSRGLLDKGMGEQLQQLARLLDELQSIAQQELRGVGLTEAEQATIGGIGDRLARLLQMPGPAGSLGPPPLPFVVDVYHHPENNHTLQAAVGPAWRLYVLLPAGDGGELSVGFVFSTYEFGRPAAEKWTNAEWQQTPARGEPAGWLQQVTASGR